MWREKNLLPWRNNYFELKGRHITSNSSNIEANLVFEMCLKRECYLIDFKKMVKIQGERIKLGVKTLKHLIETFKAFL